MLCNVTSILLHEVILLYYRTVLMFVIVCYCYVMYVCIILFYRVLASRYGSGVLP